ncbi:MAG: hypothetical protein A3C36_03085 [Omnitrophica WOR_2 bacterium RIFCSPHIGHO2_02_FULL_52_10]|nr:MAG: hypothetical protein A3C36_03085 [Omnitrophica WOR_2 bacterium RIFCSPHIGHO2_02_FULL_52_10]
MGSWEGLNRRKFPRANYPCLVVIRNQDAPDDGEHDKNSTILTHTDNIGVGGVCVILKQDLKMFSPVELELDLLDLGDHIRCNGKVVWNIRHQNEGGEKPNFYDIGIEFVDISGQDRSRLEHIINRLVKNNG